MALLAYSPRMVALDENGDPLAGAQLYTYLSGTTTPAAVYSDAALTVPHSNPVIADSGGVFDAIFLDPDVTYRFKLDDADNVQQYQQDDIAGSSEGDNTTEAEAAAGATIVVSSYPELDVRRYGALADGSTDDSTAIQMAIDVAEEKGGGRVLLQNEHSIDTALVISSHCVVLATDGGSSRGSLEVGARLIYTGDDTYAIKIDGGTGGLHGVELHNFRLENQGSAAKGVWVFNAQNCYFKAVHCREFTADNWLVECDTNVSTIYNTWVNCSGWTTGATAIGVRMTEGAAKAVNNNLFLNCNFGLNLTGIQQDTDCHDNCFSVLELGNCTTGAKLRGRTHFICANIENCTTGIVLTTGGAGSLSGSIHFSGNSADISNPDVLNVPAVMQGGNAGDSYTWSATNTALGFKGATPPSTGGINFVTNDGDPKLQRAGSNHITLESSNTLFSQKVELDDALDHDGSTAGFYGTTPVAKQTGVAVTAAAIHAALVNLGLIGA